MRIIGCDLHARQQTLAMLDSKTGEVVSVTLKHEGNNVREFYSTLPRPVRDCALTRLGLRKSNRENEPLSRLTKSLVIRLSVPTRRATS